MKIIKKAKTGIIISFFASFMICIFAPIDLYMTNGREFWFDLKTMLPVLVAMFAIAFCLNAAGYCLVRIISEKLYYAAEVLEFGLLVILYIQGNYFAGHLPSIDGSAINWSDYKSDTLHSWIIITAVFALLLIGHFFLKQFRQERVMYYLSLGICLMLAVTIVVECIGSREFIVKNLSVSVTDDGLFEMSDDKNVIVLLLDWSDSQDYEDIIFSRDEYQTVFDDFIFYRNAMGMYPFTVFSIPFILTGNRYEGQDDFTSYYRTSVAEAPAFKALEEDGYQLSLYETNFIYDDASIERFANLKGIPQAISSCPLFAKYIVKLVGFRYVPFFLKKYSILRLDDFDLLKTNVGSYDTFLWDDIGFYNNVNSRTIEKTDQKCFKFIHLEGAHPSFHLKGNMENMTEDEYPSRKDAYRAEVEAMVVMVNAYLKKLKEYGVYDNSAIIVMGDHGYNWNGDDGNNGANPIFFVKGVGEKHPFQVSDAPISYYDLQDAYIRLKDGKTGEDVFDYKEGDDRERTFLWMEEWSSLVQPLVEYKTAGHVRDTASFEKSGNVFQYTEGADTHVKTQE